MVNFRPAASWKRLPSRNRVAEYGFHQLDDFYPTGQARGSMQYSNEEALFDVFCYFFIFFYITPVTSGNHIMVRCFAQTIHFHWAFLFTCLREVGWSCKHPWIPVLRGSVLEMEIELEEMRRWMMQVWCNKSLVPLLILSSSNHIWQLFNRGAAIHFIASHSLPDWWTWWLFGLVLRSLFGVYYNGVLKKKDTTEYYRMGVSKNRGTPKWMVYNGKPY